MTDREYIERLENALASAICIIRNEAGLPANKHKADRLSRWCDELIEESRINFWAVIKKQDTKTQSDGES